MQTPLSGIEEWKFGFNVDPLSMSFMLNSGVLSSTFSGTIYDANLGDSTPVAAPVPEPSSMILVMSGLLALRKMARRSDSNSLAKK